MTQTACVISQLDLMIQDRKILTSLNFQLYHGQCSALIGANGQGKSLLLSLLAQRTIPNISASGQIQWQTQFAYLAQLQRLDANTIAEALGVAVLAKHFKHIAQGQTDAEALDAVDGHWHLPILWQQLLQDAQLPTDLDYPIAQLSEGQRTKLALCQLFQFKQHYLLLDEPSNHLDQHSRAWLIKAIQQHPAGCLLVSHDRELLDQVQHIYALSQQQLHHVRGNYTHYQQQQQLQRAALEQRVADGQKQLTYMVQQQQQAQRKAEKRQQSGNKIRQSGSQAKILLDFKKEQAQQSMAARQKQFSQQHHKATTQLQAHQQQLFQVKAQRLQLLWGTQRKSAEILRCKHLQLPQLQHAAISFALNAGEKIQLAGNNGCGKSTLLALIAAQAICDTEKLYCAVDVLYIDQHFSMLDRTQSAVDNLRRLYPKPTDLHYRRLLGQLQLKAEKACCPLAQLSGGEQLKVALLYMSQISAEVGLLLLDEPENHLDIASKEILADAIRAYPGSVILVSHDRQFVRDCGIVKVYQLS
ncbi:ATP-binding cassette domain-containing protein [Acinetobacter larvae]|uniref:ABC transporter domain-containing protein n=1 Tax=Acinetobacter larvae TaxID=1789224 RepID=A0A1B2LZP3_9GAMM|nr:ATP-binding cassette domain-containing protein [Acinetobacter larvae]AOA58397.1 hypothetical protein BFG52_08550 [Acinetobacter larvae]